MYEVNYDELKPYIDNDNPSRAASNLLCRAIISSSIMVRREQLGMTRKELAKKLSVSVRKVRKLEEGVIEPSAEQIEQLVRLFCPKDYCDCTLI